MNSCNIRHSYSFIGMSSTAVHMRRLNSISRRCVHDRGEPHQPHAARYETLDYIGWTRALCDARHTNVLEFHFWDCPFGHPAVPLISIGSPCTVRRLSATFRLI